MTGTTSRAAAIVAISVVSLVAASCTRADERPSLVLIVADDLRADDLAFLPALAALRGTTFTRAYATPLCTPSRVSLLTGLGLETHGVTGNDPSRFDASDTIATRLRAAGYRTAIIGKQVNYPGKVKNGRRGWDTFVVLRSHVSRGTGQTDFLADRAVEFVSTAARPFFLYLAPVAPHGPLDGPDRYAGRAPPPWDAPPSLDESVRRKAETERARRYRQLLGLNDLLERVLGALPDDTVVVFASDNGYLLGEHGIIGKQVLYEEAIRVPLLVAAGGPSTSGVTSSSRFTT